MFLIPTIPHFSNPFQHGHIWESWSRLWMRGSNYVYPSILLFLEACKSSTLLRMNSFTGILLQGFFQNCQTLIFEEHLSMAASVLRKVHVESSQSMWLAPIHYCKYNRKATEPNSFNIDSKMIFTVCEVQCYHISNMTIQQKIINSDFP